MSRRPWNTVELVDVEFDMATELEDAAARYHKAVEARKHNWDRKVEADEVAEAWSLRYSDSVRAEEAAEKALKAVAGSTVIVRTVDV